MAVAALTKPELFTAQDMGQLSAREYRYELIQGELQTMIPPGGMHGGTTSRLSIYVGRVIIDKDLGVNVHC